MGLVMGKCADAAVDKFLKAVELFNQGDWFRSHELIEDLWIDEQGETREFYQGIIQLGAALYHWKRGNFNGAVLLLEKGLDRLRKAGPICIGVDAKALVLETDRLRQELQSLGPEHMVNLDPELIPRLHMTDKP